MRNQGVRYATDALPTALTGAVLWGWTTQLVIAPREVDAERRACSSHRNPSIVPFPVDEARAQLADSYTWGP